MLSHPQMRCSSLTGRGGGAGARGGEVGGVAPFPPLHAVHPPPPLRNSRALPGLCPSEEGATCLPLWAHTHTPFTPQPPTRRAPCGRMGGREGCWSQTLCCSPPAPPRAARGSPSRHSTPATSPLHAHTISTGGRVSLLFGSEGGSSSPPTATSAHCAALPPPLPPCRNSLRPHRAPLPPTRFR